MPVISMFYGIIRMYMLDGQLHNLPHLHGRDALMADWELARSGQLPYKIDPL
jgi:hypothetical protein